MMYNNCGTESKVAQFNPTVAIGSNYCIRYALLQCAYVLILQN